MQFNTHLSTTKTIGTAMVTALACLSLQSNGVTAFVRPALPLQPRINARSVPLSLEQRSSVKVHSAAMAVIKPDPAAKPASTAAPAASVEEPKKKTIGTYVDDHIHEVLAATIAGMACWYMNNAMGYGPIKANGVLGVIIGVLLPLRIATPAFCGLLAGMASLAMAPTAGGMLKLGLLTGFLLAIFNRKKVFVGRGGRLGVVANLACCVIVFIKKNILALSFIPLAVSVHQSINFLDPATYGSALATAEKVQKALAVAVAGVLAGTFASRANASILRKLGELPGAFGALCKRSTNNIVAASLTMLYVTCGKFDPMFFAPVYTGSILSMTAPGVLTTKRGLAYASIVAGLLHVALTGTLTGGWSGKMGTVALMGVVACELTMALRGLLKKKLEASVEAEKAGIA